MTKPGAAALARTNTVEVIDTVTGSEVSKFTSLYRNGVTAVEVFENGNGKQAIVIARVAVS